MTDFAQELRHRCPESEMPNEACGPGRQPTPCVLHAGLLFHASFAKETSRQEGATRKFCNGPGCRTEYHGNKPHFEPYGAKADHAPVRSTVSSKSAQSTGIKIAHNDDRPWRLATGPVITATQYHCATVPDGPDCQWTGGEWRRIEARNRALLENHKKSKSRRVKLRDHPPSPPPPYAADPGGYDPRRFSPPWSVEDIDAAFVV